MVLYSGQVEFEALQAACRSGLWGVPSEPETKLKMRLPRMPHTVIPVTYATIYAVTTSR